MSTANSEIDRLVNVDWDAEPEDLEFLPKEVNVPWFVPEEDVTDYLTDLTGFCVNACYES